MVELYLELKFKTNTNMFTWLERESLSLICEWRPIFNSSIENDNKSVGGKGFLFVRGCDW